MAISFPSNPTLNQIYSFGQNSWIWDGSEWTLYINPSPTYTNLTVTGTLTAAQFAPNGYSTTAQMTDAINVALSQYAPVNNTTLTGTTTITGPAYVGGVLYGGPTNSTIGLANPVAVFTNNVNNYSQIQLQNRSNGNNASSDVVATADIGSDGANYIDMGINSSGWNSSAWTISGATDGYLYVNGGNLTLGTDTAGKTVSVHTGGTLASNIVATFGAANTVSSSVSSGALVVNGGVGLSGNLNVGGNAIITGNLTVNGTTTTVNRAVINQTETITGAMSVTNTTISTNTATGALTVAGGVGVAGAVYAGAVYDSGTRVATASKAIALSMIFSY